MTQPLTLVVGAGGLLGRHVTAELARRGVPCLPSSTIPWEQPRRAQRVLEDAGRTLARQGGNEGWQLLWCAGAGVTGTSAEAFAAELAALRAALSGLADSGSPGHRGAVFLASSAGGVYAGVGAPPYSEDSPVAPLAPYGHAKLEAEAVVREFGAAHGVRVLVGRIANLYGPGQNLAKAQGLVSQLCAAYLRREPITIWSSLDTIRDYIYAADCAGLVLDAMDRLRSVGSGAAPVTKILATGRGMTIAEVIGSLRHVFRRRPQIILGASPASALQARDLSMRSVVWPELDDRQWTPFAVGVLQTLQELRVDLADSA